MTVTVIGAGVIGDGRVAGDQARQAADQPFEVCRICGTPRVDGCRAVVMYFPADADFDQLTAEIEAALPGAKVYPVPPPGAR